MANPLEALWQRWQERRGGPRTEEIQALSEQFRVTLEAAAAKVVETDQNREILSHVRQLLRDPDWSWKYAYEVEQQMVLLYGAEALRTELSRRILVEAPHVLYPDTTAWYRNQLDKAQTLEDQRVLLSRLVNDLQWRYTVNETKLGYVRKITGRTGWIFIIAVVIFIGFLFVLWDFGASAAGDRAASWVEQHSQFLTFMLAAVSGFLGASFSMVSGLKSRLESSSLNQMKNASSRAILLSRVLVGTGAAMILYFFFESNLLAGEAFPKLVAPAGAEGEAYSPVVHRALLVVWCFIAGFSEKLVPGLLAKTEGRLDEQQAAPHPPAPENLPRPTDTEPGEGEPAPPKPPGEPKDSGAKGEGKGS